MLILSTDLIEMIGRAGIPLDTFRKLLVAEEFTQEEIDDLEYMQDKTDIYLENK